MANKFKIGDIIAGTEESSKEYSYTSEFMTKGEVVDVLSSDRVKVKILEHITVKGAIGMEHNVYSKYFDLVKSKTPVVNIEGVSVENNESTKLININGNLIISIPTEFTIGISAKLEEDTYCETIGKALAFYRHENGGNV